MVWLGHQGCGAFKDSKGRRGWAWWVLQVLTEHRVLRGRRECPDRTVPMGSSGPMAPWGRLVPMVATAFPAARVCLDVTAATPDATMPVFAAMVTVTASVLC